MIARRLDEKRLAVGRPFLQERPGRVMRELIRLAAVGRMARKLKQSGLVYQSDVFGSLLKRLFDNSPSLLVQNVLEDEQLDPDELQRVKHAIDRA